MEKACKKNSHRGEKTFSSGWENFFTVVRKLFHHGENTFKGAFVLMNDYLLILMSVRSGHIPAHRKYYSYGRRWFCRA